MIFSEDRFSQIGKFMNMNSTSMELGPNTVKSSAHWLVEKMVVNNLKNYMCLKYVF